MRCLIPTISSGLEIWDTQGGDTQQVDVAVTLLTYMWEVLGANLGQNSDYPDLAYYGFPQTLQTNVKILILTGQKSFFPNPFQYSPGNNKH
jgi:hypothetical protein